MLVVAIAIGVAVGAGITLLDAARRTRTLILEQARGEADATRREAAIEAREQAVKLRSELESEMRERRDELL